MPIHSAGEITTPSSIDDEDVLVPGSYVDARAVSEVEPSEDGLSAVFKRGNGDPAGEIPLPSAAWGSIQGDPAVGREALQLDTSGGVGDGTANDRAALAAADATAQFYGIAIRIPKGVYRIGSNLQINSPIIPNPDALLRPDNGVQVTLAAGVVGDCRKQIFDHSNGGIVLVRKADYYHPGWWGPVGTADDSQTWKDMQAAITASRVSSGEYFGQKVLAPAGVNRFINVAMANCIIVADFLTNCFLPPLGTTSGVVLTLEHWTSITGGYFRTDEPGQAVTLLWQKGRRAQVDNVYIEPNAANSKGLIAGWTGQASSTPVVNNLRIRSGNAVPAAGSIGLEMQSADAEMTNIWVARCDTGILGTRAGAGRWTNVHSWENNTGIGGNDWDATQVNNLYLDSNRGWGMDIDAMERAIWNGIYAWNNGYSIPGTGGVRLRRTGSFSARRSSLLGVILNDNVGHGMLVDRVDDYEIDVVLSSSSMQGGGPAVTTVGVEITSTTTNLSRRVRGSGAATPIVDSSSSTIPMDNLAAWAPKAIPSGTVLGATDIQTVQNKTLDNTNTVRLRDSLFFVQDAADPTKRALFNVPSGQSPNSDATHTLPSTSSTLASVADINAAINNLVNAAPGALDTLKELSDALGGDANFATTVTNLLALKAALASPAFTGAPTINGKAVATSEGPFPADRLTAGCLTVPRWAVTSSAVPIGVSGDLGLTYFTADKSEPWANVVLRSGSTAAAATPTLARIGLYSVAANGDITLVASTPNDTSLLAATATTYTKAFSAAHTSVYGQRYAIGALVVSAGTMPTLQGTSAPSSVELGVAPRMTGRVTGQSDLPASVAAGSIASGNNPFYARLA